jgi:hypothetical protein
MAVQNRTAVKVKIGDIGFHIERGLNEVARRTISSQLVASQTLRHLDDLAQNPI